MKHKPDTVDGEEVEVISEPDLEEETNEDSETILEETEVDWESVANEKDKQNADLINRLQRNMAEFDNFRKRTIREKASIYDDGVKDTIEKLLPVVDNFERALSTADDRENSLYKGVDMMFRQLCDILKEMDVEPLPGVGETFDPNVHHAVAHVQDEALGENLITEELLKGYKYKDKVLRPSMVKVVN